MSIAPRSPMSESLATIPWDGAESKEVYGRGSIRARFHEGGGGGGVSRLPIRRQKKAANAMTATMIKTPATTSTVFSPPGSKGCAGGRGRRRDRRSREEGGRDAQSHDECRMRF